MRHSSPVWGLLVALVCGAPDGAMAQAREPLHGVVAELRLVTPTLPSAVGWTSSSLPAGAVVPGRGFGVDVGAHVLVGPGRHRRLGLGVTALVSQGRSTGLAPAPTATTRFITAAPHVSINFGHALGWSHLSAGVGTAKVTAKKALVNLSVPVKDPHGYRERAKNRRNFMENEPETPLVRSIESDVRIGSVPLSRLNREYSESIAAGKTQGVVNALKVIEVEGQHRECAGVAPGQCQRLY